MRKNIISDEKLAENECLKVIDLVINFTPHYNNIHHISFTLKKGEVLAFSSKDKEEISSLFRVLAGVREKHKGCVIRNIENIAYQPIKPQFLNKKSVLENLVYPMKIRKYSTENIDENIKFITDTFTLPFSLNAPIKTLTNYEKMMVSLLRFLVRKIDLIIIDDLFQFSLLDEKKMLVKIIEIILKKNENISFIYFSNDEYVLNQLKGKKLTLKNGSLS